MKKFIENLIILGFLLFFLGGLAMVAFQVWGLIIQSNEFVVQSKKMFSWIFPAATLTGLVCYLYSYIGDKDE